MRVLVYLTSLSGPALQEIQVDQVTTISLQPDNLDPQLAVLWITSAGRVTAYPRVVKLEVWL